MDANGDSQDSPSSKKARTESHSGTTGSGSAHPTAKATSITQGTPAQTATTAGQPRKRPGEGGELGQPPTKHQVQTPEGNALNERGSIAGEAGNRKIQKEAITYGVIDVSTMSANKINLFGFVNEEQQQDLSQTIEVIYPNANLLLFKTKLLNHLKMEVETYWVLTSLGFNMRYETMAMKFGESIKKAQYIFQKNMECNWENPKEIRDGILPLLTICFKNNANLMTFQEACEREANSSRFRTQNESKKRKFVLDD